MTRTQAYWICQVVGWTAYVTSRTGMSMFFRDVTTERIIFTALVGCVGLLVTHLYRLGIKRLEWTELSLGQMAPRVIVASLAVSAAMHFSVDPVGRYVLELQIYEEIDSEIGLAVMSIMNGSLIILLWSLIYFGVHIFWNHQQAEIDKWKLEAQAETARLQALKLQLNPHFFFNSLNSVRALISEDPQRAQRMVTRLARLLRATLQVDDVKTVPLEEELSTVRTYLELEKVRFENRLRYEIDVAEDALSRPVPFLIVQTLVENGIKHGVAKRQDGGLITVDARVEEDVLRLEVTNPGQLEGEEGGIGLSNARERLRLLFGEEASLTLSNGDSDTVVATARLPSDRTIPAQGHVDRETPAELVTS